MVDLDDAIVARLESHGERFEVLLDPKAMDLIKQGKDVDLADYLAVEDVFKDARKGTRPETSKLDEVFGTQDPVQIARRIIEKGDVQMTAEQRREILDAKRKRVIAYISANAINPQNHLPHPPIRIETALEEGKYHVEYSRSFEKEVEEAMKVLRPLLPIRFEKSRIAVRVKADDYGRVYGELSSYGAVEREEWSQDGWWMCTMEVPGGLVDEITSKLNQKTKGTAMVKLLTR